MNWLDCIIALILIASFISGLRKGLVRIVIGLIAVITGFLAASWFYGLAGGFLVPYVPSRGVANFVGFVLVFGTFLLIGALLGRLLSGVFSTVGLSWLDRLAGGAFGLLRGVLVATVLLMILLAFTPNSTPSGVAGSSIAPYILGASRVLASVTPHEIRSGFRRSSMRVQEIWQDAWRNGRKRMPGFEL